MGETEEIIMKLSMRQQLEGLMNQMQFDDEVDNVSHQGEFKFDSSSTLVDIGSMFHPGLHKQLTYDARALGNLSENILQLLFSNLIRKHDDDYYDMDTPDGRRVEVRVRKHKEQYSFEASANVGAGRSGQAQDKTIQKIRDVTDWIFLDISTFPQVAIKHVEGEKVREYFFRGEGAKRKAARVSSSKFKELF